MKLCPEAFHKGLTIWFYDWWQKCDTSLDMLPEPKLNLYESWVYTHFIIHNMKENKVFEGLFYYFFTKVEILWI